MRAGMLRTRVAFLRKEIAGSRYSDSGGPAVWRELFSRAAHVRFERGRERVEAGRLQEAVAGVVRVKADSGTKSLTPADVAQIDGERHQIRAIITLEPGGEYLEITIERGAVT